MQSSPPIGSHARHFISALRAAAMRRLHSKTRLWVQAYTGKPLEQRNFKSRRTRLLTPRGKRRFSWRLISLPAHNL